MTDTFHLWGKDTSFSAIGDQLTVDGFQELEQRILRALLTNPLDDPFNPTYGKGIGRYIGQALTPEKKAQIQADVFSVLMVEPDVQKIPLPAITYQSDNNSYLSVTISYIYAPTGQQRAITA